MLQIFEENAMSHIKYRKVYRNPYLHLCLLKQRKKIIVQLKNVAEVMILLLVLFAEDVIQ